MFHSNNLQNDLWRGNDWVYPRDEQQQVDVAITEALAWLSAQGLTIPAPGSNGMDGWFQLSRRAAVMQTAVDSTKFQVGRLLPKELLHRRIRKAFAPQDGPLTDMTAEGGERQGRVELFAGAIASYKNPHSHRDVNLENPHEALEIILQGASRFSGGTRAGNYLSWRR
jgi:hypothetical protein